jgi:hypothetical protein
LNSVPQLALARLAIGQIASQGLPDVSGCQASPVGQKCPDLVTDMLTACHRYEQISENVIVWRYHQVGIAIGVLG